MKKKIFDFAVVVSLLAGIILSVVDFEYTCKGIRQQVLRLHIIADSDSEQAQGLKLKVRDEILAQRGELFREVQDLDEAQAVTKERLEEIEKIAYDTLKREGSDLSVEASLEISYFPTRQYGETMTLPAGYYNALKVTIGEGEGKNWWCVMFPPMCLSAAKEQREVMSDVLTESEMKLVTSKPKYEVRFWIVEKYWELKSKLFGKEASD